MIITLKTFVNKKKSLISELTSCKNQVVQLKPKLFQLYKLRLFDNECHRIKNTTNYEIHYINC